MKTTLSLFLSFFIATFVYSHSGALIEYKITTSAGYNGTIKISTSDYGSISEFNMVIPQMPGGGMMIKSLMQKNNPLIYTINDKSKSYSEVSPTDPSNNDTKTYTVKKLGEENVNGYKCIHALITEGAETSEVWNTKDIAEFNKYAEAYKTNKRIGSAKRDQAFKAAGCDGLPVKSIHKGNAREGDMTMELVKIEKKTFSKSDFDLPAGYTKTSGAGAVSGMKSQQEIMNMSPEERAKYMDELKKQYGR